jgi:hypothetical protein
MNRLNPRGILGCKTGENGGAIALPSFERLQIGLRCQVLTFTVWRRVKGEGCTCIPAPPPESLPDHRSAQVEDDRRGLSGSLPAMVRICGGVAILLSNCFDSMMAVLCGN